MPESEIRRELHMGRDQSTQWQWDTGKQCLGLLTHSRVKAVGLAEAWPRQEVRCPSPSHRGKGGPAFLSKGAGRRNPSEAQYALRHPGYGSQIAEKVGFRGRGWEERAQELFFWHQVWDSPVEGAERVGCQNKVTNRAMACTAHNSGNESHLSVHLVAKGKVDNNQKSSFFR